MIHDLLPKTVEGALTILGGWIGLIWSATLQSVAPLAWWFAIFVLTDLITGVWAGVKTTGFSSKALYAGMFRKALPSQSSSWRTVLTSAFGTCSKISQSFNPLCYAPTAAGSLAQS